MSLTTPPNPPSLIQPDLPFLLTAIWTGDHTPTDRRKILPETLYLAVAEYPGAWPHEYAIPLRLELCRPLIEVQPEELPIALCLRNSADPAETASAGPAWRFEYLGGPEFFAVDQLHPPIPVVEPTPMSPEQLSASAQAMLRSSLGLPADAPLPAPPGPLPPAEQPEEPYRFDPTQHMDLSKAEPAPDWGADRPAPAPPGPPPDPGATTSPVPQLPPPAPSGPAPAPDADPFVH